MRTQCHHIVFYLITIIDELFFSKTNTSKWKFEIVTFSSAYYCNQENTCCLNCSIKEVAQHPLKHSFDFSLTIWTEMLFFRNAIQNSRWKGITLGQCKRSSDIFGWGIKQIVRSFGFFFSWPHWDKMR